MAWRAWEGKGLPGEPVREMLIEAVERRFGTVEAVPAGQELEFLSDNVLNARGALPIGNSIAHRSYSADRWMAKSNAQSQRRGSAVRGCLG